MTKVCFDNSYAKLPNEFYSRLDPDPVEQPSLIQFNQALAEELGVMDLYRNEAEAVAFFSGNTVPEGAEPIAMAYAGHQFGGFSPQLGDGRAILLGEVISPAGDRYDIQLKGSGRTPWSRGGDGRSALGPVIREYLVSEAMHKLGVPTTRALAAVTTGEKVARTTLLPGGIITRVAKGFIRVGTFEYFSRQRKEESVKILADYAIERFYPDAMNADNPYAALLGSIADRQASLIAKWMGLGFIHGVMNTDNMSVVGETIDYGPCAFMDEFTYNRVYSSIDSNGRYAYNNQPQIGQWNLIRLAETLLPFMAENQDDAVKIAQGILKDYQEHYVHYWQEGMGKKIGLLSAKDDDVALIGELQDIMAANEADFSLVFYYLSQLDNKEQGKKLRELFAHPDQFDPWFTKWQDRLRREDSDALEQQALMESVNPVYIPRNHQIEAAIQAAENNNDFTVFHELHKVLQKPFELQAGKEAYMLPPRPDQMVLQTFCGT